MGIFQDEVAEILVSQRDGGPFRIRYGLSGLADRAMIFETTGVDGQRLLAFTSPSDAC